MGNKLITVWRSLGPGLMWAGTAVGVSHLVQSTRAGASYGLTLLWLVIVVHLVKWPAFEAGPRYVAATGQSLINSYRRQGWWALAVFGLQTVLTMAIVEAAVAMVTAGMASTLLPVSLDVTVWSGLLLVSCWGLLAAGRFASLDTLMKAMVTLLSVATLLAVTFSLGAADWSRVPVWPPLPPLEGVHIAFLAAFIGWMPAPFDTAVWQSQWSVAREAASGSRPWPIARRDFMVGYVGTAVLALAFVTLGAVLLAGTGTELPAQAPAFAALLIDMYGDALGTWARPVLLVAAFMTMVSTTLAVTDGFPRALTGVILGEGSVDSGMSRRVYLGIAALLVGAAQVIVVGFASNLTALVDLATTVSFVLTPVLAYLNLRAITGEEVEAGWRPTGWLLWWHILGIGASAVFSVAWMWWRFAA